MDHILDTGGKQNEIIVKAGNICLTRENMVTLGLERQMDSMVVTVVLINCQQCYNLHNSDNSLIIYIIR